MFLLAGNQGFPPFWLALTLELTPTIPISSAIILQQFPLSSQPPYQRSRSPVSLARFDIIFSTLVRLLTSRPSRGLTLLERPEQPLGLANFIRQIFVSLMGRVAGSRLFGLPDRKTALS